VLPKIPWNWAIFGLPFSRVGRGGRELIPSITIFVRHSGACKYAGDETWKRCDCRKSLRWFQGGRQYKRSAKTRSWTQAEEEKRKLEEKFEAGAKPTALETSDRKTLERAIELFISDKRSAGRGDAVVDKYERELARFREFAENRSKLFPSDIDGELLIEYRATWTKLYPSSQTRQQVQTRLRGFLSFCHAHSWLDRVPKLSTIKADEPPTLPLSKAEYEKLLVAIPKIFPTGKAARVRALVQLMRHSGLAIRDAVTLERSELVQDKKKNLTRVTIKRQKTGTDVSVPLPPAVAAEVVAVLNGNPRYVFWTGSGLETSAVTNWQHDLRALFRTVFGNETHFTPHCLRDTAAVEWLLAGIPLAEVSKLLGHENIKTTEKSYAPWMRERQDRLDSLVVATWQ
jgi:integrase/recombinase XerD